MTLIRVEWSCLVVTDIEDEIAFVFIGADQFGLQRNMIGERGISDHLRILVKLLTQLRTRSEEIAKLYLLGIVANPVR
jgi:hypothetical protein